jgi:hypothetical protein
MLSIVFPLAGLRLEHLHARRLSTSCQLDGLCVSEPFGRRPPILRPLAPTATRTPSSTPAMLRHQFTALTFIVNTVNGMNSGNAVNNGNSGPVCIP